MIKDAKAWRMVAVMIGVTVLTVSAFAAEIELLNVSYDPTRELYKEINQEFCAFYKETQGVSVLVNQSHGGAGKQARSVINGLEADVVTLALAYDIDAMHSIAGLIPEDWQTRLPHNSCPYTSTIVFLVRKGNPKQIKDWDDLVRKEVAVITPNPKTSGGARWNYLAAWGYALKQYGEAAKAQEFVTKLYRNVPVLDTGARGSTTTFIRGMGDVLITWENEALLAVKKLGQSDVEIVAPSISILAEPPVTIIDKNVEKHKTREIAEAYLRFLYTKTGQTLCGKNFYRPQDPEVAAQYADQFPKVQTFSIADLFGGWQAAQQQHFSDGGVFDQIYIKH